MRNILITGGTGKIGKILVKSMINDGHQVIFTTRTKSKGIKLVSELGEFKTKCYVIEADFLKFKDNLSWINELPLKIDTIIHNARSLDNIKADSNGRITTDQFYKEFNMAVTIPYKITYSLIDNEHPLNDIIFISSMYGVVAPTPKLYDNFNLQSPINYGIAKAAQIHLTKELAVRLSEKKIKVNCISFGGLEGRTNDLFKKRYNDLTPMGRMIQYSDIYPPFKFLLDNNNLAITGQNIQIDGGWTIW